MRYFLELCLQSVIAATEFLDAEIIVVDNASSDESCSMVKKKFPEVKLIENPQNFGFSKGNNIGVAKAVGEYICILNPDTVVAEDTFSILLKFADTRKNLGIIGCKLVDGTGTFLPESKRNIPTPSVAIKKILGSSKSYYANQIKGDEVGKVDILVGAFMLMKRQVYKQLHGFGEDYFMYGEDVDLSYRVKKAGFDNFYNADTTVIHFKGESTLKDKVYAERFYGAMQIFYNKHFRKNWLFDVLVWFGIKFAKYFRNSPDKLRPKVDSFILVSDNENKEIRHRFNPLKRVLKIEDVSSKTEVIFDANYLSFKNIIECMEKLTTISPVTFKILPKKANFILGSNHSKTKGEVVMFKN